ncbi:MULTISPECIES: hypothetical protein [Shewanella]|uniref:Polysaccharide biosynthesis protein n=1 Tax=Shewanella marisflavi TaxID=260364 RepID=A0ABX5WTH9_9GAMM|nr:MULTISPECIES: hypothetical protein [Shewanella]QDF75864.1 hypothetical protein FGA12_12315 [Shewanella marisflavi]
MARQLSLNEYGVILSFFSLSVFLGSISNMGLSQYLLANSKIYNRIVFTGISTTVIVSFLLYVLVYFTMFLFKVDAILLISWLYVGFGTLTIGIFRLSAVLFQVKEKYFLVALSNGASQLVRIIALLLIIPIGINLHYFNLAFVLSSILAFTIFLILLLWFADNITYNYDFKLLKNAKNYCYSTVLTLGYTSALSPLVLFLFGAENSAFFNFYLMLLSAASVLYNSFYNNYYLKFIISEVNFFKKYTEARYISLFLVVLSAIGLMLFFTFFERILFEEKFEPGHSFIYLLSLVIVLRPISSFLGMILTRQENIRRKNRLQLISFSLCVLFIIISYIIGSFFLACLCVVFSELVLLSLYYFESRKAMISLKLKIGQS